MIKQNISIQSKLPSTGISIFAIMSKMAADYKAINLSQGFPDFNCSEELIELVHKFMKEGMNQYAPMPGLPSLRKNISEKILKQYKADYNFESEITITAGATQALYTAISAVIHSGDEVIIIEPAYDSYVPSVISNGGVPVYSEMTAGEFKINWSDIRKKISKKTKAIIINSPHNPTGSVITEIDIKMLEQLTEGTNILIISDEVYEHITFDGLPHFSISSSAELKKRSFVISSFGKTFHTTGWKVGYCCSPEYLMNEFRKMHQFIVFAVNTPVQHAYSTFLLNENNYLSLNDFYQKKRDLFLQSISGSRFKAVTARGTYFQLLDYSQISDQNDMEFSEWLTKEIGVAVIPLQPFYSKNNSQKLIRVCFAKKDEVLIQAGKILKSI
jgi:methionine aminotransferase